MRGLRAAARWGVPSAAEVQPQPRGLARGQRRRRGDARARGTPETQAGLRRRRAPGLSLPKIPRVRSAPSSANRRVVRVGVAAERESVAIDPLIRVHVTIAHLSPSRDVRARGMRARCAAVFWYFFRNRRGKLTTKIASGIENAGRRAVSSVTLELHLRTHTRHTHTAHTRSHHSPERPVRGIVNFTEQLLHERRHLPAHVGEHQRDELGADVVVRRVRDA